MKIRNLSLEGLKLIQPGRFPDERGFFQQCYHRQQYTETGIDTEFVQDNWSRSTKGVLRGLHYQYEHSQAKLVSVLQGEVFDVVVDMRENSISFGKWESVLLSAENGLQLYVPKGFAHGFMVLSDTADFFYKCDDFYASNDEYGVLWNDPELKIKWPRDIKPRISEKDAALPCWKDSKTFHAGCCSSA
ncbi:MAG: dTDP-4-dehydrorhamnose 3,5-epimerase [Kiritimatiellia bacterium]